MDYLKLIKYIIIVLFCFTLIIAVKQCSSYKENYYNALSNVEAYQVRASNSENKVLQYSMTIESLRASKDSVDTKILALKDSLKIKDKAMQYAIYNKNIITKIDTVFIQDTIFNEGVCIDTSLIEPWYQLNLHLEYPSKVIINPTFKNEHTVIINSNKEFDKKPSKIFFVRWFQRKHTVVEVHIDDKNPYIYSEDNKFIKIIKD